VEDSPQVVAPCLLNRASRFFGFCGSHKKPVMHTSHYFAKNAGLALQVLAPAGEMIVSPNCAFHILVSYDQRRVCLS